MFLLLKLTIIQIVYNFVVWLLLHRDDGLVPSRVERLHVAVLQFDLRNFIEVQDRFVSVADTEVLVDHQCDLNSCEKAFFFLCSFLFKKGSSLEVSVDDLLASGPRADRGSGQSFPTRMPFLSVG